jgi:hypothetical protein
LSLESFSIGRRSLRRLANDRSLPALVCRGGVANSLDYLIWNGSLSVGNLPVRLGKPPQFSMSVERHSTTEPPLDLLAAVADPS